MRTSSLRGYLLLRVVARLGRWRRRTLRFAAENERIEQWLLDIRAVALTNPALATEIARNQRLVKGYGDTHERGLRNYDAVRTAWRDARGRLGADGVAELRQAALADEHGQRLSEALRRLAVSPMPTMPEGGHP